MKLQSVEGNIFSCTCAFLFAICCSIATSQAIAQSCEPVDETGQRCISFSDTKTNDPVALKRRFENSCAREIVVRVETDEPPRFYDIVTIPPKGQNTDECLGMMKCHSLGGISFPQCDSKAEKASTTNELDEEREKARALRSAIAAKLAKGKVEEAASESARNITPTAACKKTVGDCEERNQTLFSDLSDDAKFACKRFCDVQLRDACDPTSQAIRDANSECTSKAKAASIDINLRTIAQMNKQAAAKKFNACVDSKAQDQTNCLRLDRSVRPFCLNEAIADFEVCSAIANNANKDEVARLQAIADKAGDATNRASENRDNEIIQESQTPNVGQQNVPPLSRTNPLQPSYRQNSGPVPTPPAYKPAPPPAYKPSPPSIPSGGGSNCRYQPAGNC